jgi:thiol-disulfide isomerase/thioredoxin
VKLPSRAVDWIIWAAIGGAAFVLLRQKSSGPAEGTLAPNISLPVAGTNERFELARERGKPVVLEVFASWCGACRRAAPVLAEVHRSHSPDQVKFVGVSLDDSMEDALRAKERWGIPYDVALDDGTVSRGYDVSLLPTLVVIGRDGMVRHTTTGVPSRSQLEGWIREL